MKSKSNFLWKIMVPSILIICLMGCKEKAPKEVVPEPEIVQGEQVVKSSTDDMDVHYTIEGEGDHALVFVHGWSCDQTYWKAQVPYFKDKYKVVTIDLGGHGKSGTNRADWTIASFGTDVLDVINNLEFEKLSIVGHSMGSTVVIDAASKYEKPINTLVCVDYLKKPLVALPPEVVEGMAAPIKEDFVGVTKGFVAGMFLPTSDSTLVKEISDDMSSAPSKVAIPAMMDMVSRDYSEDFKRLTNKKVNKYIINADLEPTNAAHYDSLGFKTHVMKDTGHFLMIEKADEFNTLLEGMLGEKK